MKKTILPLIATVLFSLAACKKESTCDTSNITYTNSVKAIFEQNCSSSGCHDSGSINGSLASYTDALQMTQQGRMIGAIKHQSTFAAMPQGASKLDDCTINQIEAWITGGTPN
ncbi:MAG: cytochrome c [Lewinellaceae bacterium]|nr:cytochrome c [Lewinellaceae bacterium]